MDGGRAIRAFFAAVQAELVETEAAIVDIATPVEDALSKLEQATGWLAQNGFANPDEAGGAAADYLRIFALTSLGWMWVKMAKTAQKKLAEGADGLAPYYEAKLKTARFFVQKMLPEAGGRFKSLTAGCKLMMEMDVEQF